MRLADITENFMKCTETKLNLLQVIWAFKMLHSILPEYERHLEVLGTGSRTGGIVPCVALLSAIANKRIIHSTQINL